MLNNKKIFRLDFKSVKLQQNQSVQRDSNFVWFLSYHSTIYYLEKTFIAILYKIKNF